MKPKGLAIVAVVLPLLVMGTWVISVEWSFRAGRPVELAIDGYDPRDLLSGHFVTYAVNYGSFPACSENEYRGKPRCLCLSQTPQSPLWTAKSAFDCRTSEAGRCEVFIQGKCQYGRFRAGIERVYIPETYSSRLAVLPPNATIRVLVSRSGLSRVEALLIGGKPFQEAVLP